MQTMSLILEVIIVLEILGMVVFVIKKLKQQPKDEKLASTEKMVKKILLNNKWDNIDDVIESLQKDSIHVDYNLR